MRLSELCSLNYTDIMPDGSMKILGKGNKERIIYLNDACMSAVKEYMKVRPNDGLSPADKNALFISKRRKRISNKSVQHIAESRRKEQRHRRRHFSLKIEADEKRYYLECRSIR